MKPGEGFCPVCGNPMRFADGSANIGSSSSDHAGVPPTRRRRPVNRYKAASASLVVFAMILVVLAGTTATGEQDEENGHTHTVGNLTVDGGLNSEIISIMSEDGSGYIEYVGEESDVEWLVLDISEEAFIRVGDGYERRAFTHMYGPEISISDPGYYEIMLYVDGHLTAIGDALLNGGIIENYTWSRTVDDERFGYSIHFEYEFTDFYKYSMDSTGRTMGEGLVPSEFALVDGTLLRLSNALMEEYQRVHGEDAPTDGQDYADYLLSFVQEVIGFPDPIAFVDGGYQSSKQGCGDLYLYGTEEYWAYPMETLYYKQGDCEDSSALYCALLSAAGYTSSMILVPSHVLVGVALDGYVPSEVWESRYHFVSITDGDMVMYVGDSAFNDYVPLGYITNVHMVDPDSVISISIVRPYASVMGYRCRTSGQSCSSWLQPQSS